MESVTIPMPPAVFCFPTEPNIPAGLEHENISTLYQCTTRGFTDYTRHNDSGCNLWIIWRKQNKFFRTRDSCSKLDERWYKQKQIHLVQYFIISKQVFLQESKPYGKPRQYNQNASNTYHMPTHFTKYYKKTLSQANNHTRSYARLKTVL